MRKVWKEVETAVVDVDCYKKKVRPNGRRLGRSKTSNFCRITSRMFLEKHVMVAAWNFNLNLEVFVEASQQRGGMGYGSVEIGWWLKID